MINPECPSPLILFGHPGELRSEASKALGPRAFSSSAVGSFVECGTKWVRPVEIYSFQVVTLSLLTSLTLSLLASQAASVPSFWTFWISVSNTLWASPTLLSAFFYRFRSRILHMKEAPLPALILVLKDSSVSKAAAFWSPYYLCLPVYNTSQYDYTTRR
jgi:hypothetical protein